jgi:hypothetical protein
MSGPGDGATAAEGAPPLSVLLAVRRPWPSARVCLDVLTADARSVSAVGIVAIGDAGARPSDAAQRYPGVVWLSAPGASVFVLRALALQRAQAAIVAVTEDHAVVRPGWCAGMLAAHARHPEAAAIGGAVENGATETTVDWASYFISSGPFAPPLAPDQPRISLQANASYKRAALDAGHGPMGLVMHTLNDALAACGATLIADESVRVVHDQRLSLRVHSAGHFHNGRSIAASRLPQLGWRRVAYAFGALGLPPVMLGRTLRAVLPKRRYGRQLLLGLPAMCWLLLCHAAGELAGYVSGPGCSPERVD